MMEGADASNFDLENVGPRVNGGEVDDFRCSIDELVMKLDKLEQRVNEVEKFYLNTSIKQPNTSKNTYSGKHKDKDKHIPGFKKLQQEASRREAAAAKRMEELMRQFGTILRQITQHKWAWPFMQPVDVEGLGLHDYYDIIDRPMDLSTIKNQMEARDGTGYKHVREICADVRLVFKNAMKYNDEKSDVHLMAKTLLEKFEEKWLLLLPKVNEEEKTREEEEAEAQLHMQLAQESAHAKISRDLCNELYDFDTHVEELREMVVRRCRFFMLLFWAAKRFFLSANGIVLLGQLGYVSLGAKTFYRQFWACNGICRKISIEEKRNLGVALTKLSPDDLSKALEIVAQNNSLFPASAEEVELDIDAQSELTLWRLKFFVKDALVVQGKSSSEGDNSNSANVAATNPNISAASKRKREIRDALVKNVKKRKKKSL